MNENDSNKRYYMVRAQEGASYGFDVFFKNEVVAVGWSHVDFTGFSSDQLLRKTVLDKYYSDPSLHQPWVSKKLNEVIRFKNIRKDDRILVPYYNGIRIAIARDDHKYEKSKLNEDLSNQLEVDYRRNAEGIITIPRYELSEGLQRRLRVRGSTVTDLQEFKDEIDEIFGSEKFSKHLRFTSKEEEQIQFFKEKLLSNIQEGRTNLKSGGLGLEELIKDLMILEGYSAEVLPKKLYSQGDADVKATSSNLFSDTTVMIQAKHHADYSDDTGVKQLLALRESGEVEADHYVFITTTNVNPDLRNEAESKNIQVINGEEFINWLFEHLDHLEKRSMHDLGMGV
jgi:restriction system protein